jgi:hypothetical protein
MPHRAEGSRGQSSRAWPSPDAPNLPSRAANREAQPRKGEPRHARSGRTSPSRARPRPDEGSRTAPRPATPRRAGPREGKPSLTLPCLAASCRAWTSRVAPCRVHAIAFSKSSTSFCNRDTNTRTFSSRSDPCASERDASSERVRITLVAAARRFRSAPTSDI